MRKSPLIVLSLALPVLTAVPVLTVPAPTAHPVAPKITVTSLYGVDAAALRELMPAGVRHPFGVSRIAAAATPDPAVLTARVDAAPFDLVGLTWAAGDPAADSVVSVRVREDGSWTPWEVLGVEDAGPDTTSTEGRAVRRVGTSPLLVHSADGFQVRVDRPGGHPPRDLRVNLIDAGQVGSDSHLTPSAPAGAAMAATPYPNIILRSQWGADEALRTSPAEYNATIKAGVVHHTAGTNRYTADEAAGQIRAVYAYHTQGHGWSDIGYNFLVDRFGRIFEGRAGGMDMPVRGAHAGGYNVDTFGVAAVGNYEVAAAPKVMTRAISRVLAWKLSLYNRNAYGTTALMSSGGGTARLPQGETRDFPVIMGHRDVGMTSCPGRHLTARLSAITQYVDTLIRESPVTKDPPVPPLPPPPPEPPMSAIQSYWTGLGDAAAVLGEATSAEFAVPGGAAQDFVRGRVYWSAQTGARAMAGDILRRYERLGATESALGFPTTDERATVDNGRYNLMVGGKILFHPDEGAFPLWGDIARLYDAMGNERGTLGFPREGEVDTSTPSVARQRFQGGAIYWSPDRGARAVFGGIYTRYLAEGTEDGSLGVPLTGEYPVPGGARSDFTGGALTWVAATGEIIRTP